METIITSISPLKFVCECCDFKCSKKGDLNRHLLTNKHKKMYSGTINDEKNINKCNKCFKIYKSRNGLWLHSKKCNIVTSNNTNKLYINNSENMIVNSEVANLSKIVVELIKSNTDLQKQVLEVCKNSNTNNTINTINSHNKTFNLQVFLNEKCKDAMNIMDFVNSMTLELSDLEEVGNLGYVEGISNIMIRKLNEMDIYKRPIHCSDAKREIMYVRDNNVWGKENSTYDKLRKAIKHVSHKNSCLLGPWSQKYPDCMNNQHRLNDVYIKMIGQAMGGKGEFVDSENKIMKKIAKAVLIDKTC